MRPTPPAARKPLLRLSLTLSPMKNRSNTNNEEDCSVCACQWEQRKLRLYSAFLAELSRWYARAGVALYYPGAGGDIVAALATGCSEVFCIDPRYFRRGGRFTRRAVAGLLSRFDSHYQIRISTPRVLCVHLMVKGKPRQVWFVRGFNRNAYSTLRRYAPKRIVYLAKGTVDRELLFPPNWVAKLHPVAYALEAAFPHIREKVQERYRGLLFKRKILGGHLLIYKQYEFGRPLLV